MEVSTYTSSVAADITAYKTAHPNKIYSDVTDSSGNQYVDLVMEGGGVLGLALVGYTYALEQLGIRFWRIGGASAGAINAMMLATGSPFGNPASEQVLEYLSKLDISSFIDGNFLVRWFIKYCVLNKGWARYPVALLVVPLALQIAIVKGLNPGKSFVKSVRGFIDSHLPPATNSDSVLKRLLDFIKVGSDLRYENSSIVPDTTWPRLSVVASEITTQTKAQFPAMAKMYWANEADADPALFVRASMSIPLFFRPFVANALPTGDQALTAWSTLAAYTGDLPTSCTFVDGGMMSNFPIGLFHTENSLVPRAPTFGGRLNKKDRVLQSTKDLFPFLGAMFNASRHTLDYDFLMNHPDYQNLIAYIDTGDQNWLNFYLTDSDKLFLFKCGVKSALDFLATFDWENYKNIRASLGDNLPWPKSVDASQTTSV